MKLSVSEIATCTFYYQAIRSCTRVFYEQRLCSRGLKCDSIQALSSILMQMRKHTVKRDNKCSFFSRQLSLFLNKIRSPSWRLIVINNTVFVHILKTRVHECIPKLEFPEIPNKDELVVSKLQVNCKLRAIQNCQIL